VKHKQLIFSKITDGYHFSFCQFLLMFIPAKTKMMHRNLLLILLLFWGLNSLWAQIPQQAPAAGEGQAYALINQANAEMSADPVSALSHVEEALNLSLVKRDKRAEGYCHNTLGAINYELSRYELSVDHYLKAIALFENIGEQQGLYNSYKYLGMAYDGNGNAAKALETYEQFLQMARKADNTGDIADVENRIARIHFNRKDYGTSLVHYNNVLKLYQEQQAVPKIINTFNTMGQACSSLGDSTQALQYFQSAEQLALESGNYNLLPQSISNTATYYTQQKSYDKAISTRKRAVSSNQAVGSKKGEMEELVEIGNLYLEQNQAAEAIPYFKQTIDLGEELGPLGGLRSAGTTLPDEEITEADFELERPASPEFGLDSSALASAVASTAEEASEPFTRRDENSERQIANAKPRNARNLDENRTFKRSPEPPERNAKFRALNGLAQAYESQGQLEEALENLKEANKLERELLQEQIEDLEAQLASTVETSQEVEKVSARIIDRQAELKRQRLINYALIAILLVLGVSGVLVLRSYRARQVANQKLALKSLRSQMNPHFIFNSLNSVNSFIAKNDARAANKYLADFARLMRSVMENSQNEFVPLSTEIQMLELYLGLEHFRFQDRFDYRFAVDPAIDREEVMIPPMLIQPYIENAIWHGLRYKKEKGHLAVDLKQDEAHLIISIEDDGIGRERSRELKTKNQKKQRSTGLKNTAARLQLINNLYDKSLRVEINDLQAEAEDVGTSVTIYLPLTSADES
jgi:tetratricopeptide (TPR) repeat protein